MMKAGFSYRCNSCGELLTHVIQGACPVCRSQAVIPLGWFEISLQERKDWLQRIRGLRRGSQSQDNQMLQHEKLSPLPDEHETGHK
jgi:hypothetical protein